MEGIQYYRKQRGWTVKELAKRTGYPVASISRWENRVRPISIEALQAIANALDVPASLILEYEIDREGPRLIMVQAIAAANSWVEDIYLPEGQQRAVAVPLELPDKEEKNEKEKEPQRIIAVEVSDGHADKKYPKGSILLVLVYAANRPQLLTKDKRYLVQRIDEEGRFEVTVMRLEVNPNDEMWLVSEAVDPALNRSLRYRPANPALKIIGRVLRGIVDD